MPHLVQFGLDTFGDVTVDSEGRRLSHAQVLRNTVEQGVLADRLGIDAFGVGEHHRDDFAVSAPEIVLAAIAARTERIVLGTAVTVLSSDDPVRVYEKFATLDAVSSGRAEITLGRGSFTESFPLFGFDLADYEVLFTEKLDLFAALRSEQAVTWQGTTRGPLNAAQVYPRTESGSLSTWIGVGGSPESVIRAAQYRLPVGSTPPVRGRVGRCGAGPALPALQGEPRPDRPGARLAAATRDQFEAEADHGSLYVGSAETVAARIARTVQTLGLSRFDLKYSNGTMPHEHLMRTIELYGTEVIPRVRALLALDQRVG